MVAAFYFPGSYAYILKIKTKNLLFLLRGITEPVYRGKCTTCRDEYRF